MHLLLYFLRNQLTLINLNQHFPSGKRYIFLFWESCVSSQTFSILRKENPTVISIILCKSFIYNFNLKFNFFSMFSKMSIKFFFLKIWEPKDLGLVKRMESYYLIFLLSTSTTMRVQWWLWKMGIKTFETWVKSSSIYTFLRFMYFAV